MEPVQPVRSEAFLAYMAEVRQCELSLRELSQMWRLIEASAMMNCAQEARLLLPAMQAARTGLTHLEGALITNLVREKVAQALAGIGTKARYMIDILVRNLFERTADVGFLATDSELCRFVAGLDTDRAAVLERLAEYRAKYTVYDEILLLDARGRVLAQADPAAPLERSADPLLAATLASAGYVETFRASDLRPGRPRALIYSHRMTHPGSGEPIGVLCLCFHFEQEMRAVFDTYRDPDGRANMLLLDADDRVISSADPHWIPPGVRVPTNPGGSPEPLLFAGREYLVRTVGSDGYQGYPGPAGWKGQVMIPVELAFRERSAERGGALAQCEPSVLRGLRSHADSFSPPLHELMSSVTQATRTIERIVWNGKVATAANEDGGKLNTVLDQITDTGARGDALFSQSIQDLYQTVVSSSLHAAESTAQLLVDMLDRNLYERANDCRWWARAAQLRHGLARPERPGQAAAIGAVLAHINGLYTVYSRLFVYDRNGRVVASSGAQDIVGERIAAETLGRVCALGDEQQHYPEPFAPAPFYGGRPTFVYHAAVRHPEHETQVVGGIGIVFDGEPELLNMLRGGVAGRPNLRAYFVTPAGRVLAATDPDCPPGSQLELEPGLLAACGHGASRVVVHRGQYAIAAAATASGYREFRAGAAREDEVIGLVLESFGPVRADAQPAMGGAALRIEPRAAAVRADAARPYAGRPYATFYVGRALMAVAAAHVLESVPCARMRRTPGAAGRLGLLDGQHRQTTWVFDLAHLINGGATPLRPDSQIVLVRRHAHTIGLLVDELHSVQPFDDADMTPLPLQAGGHALSTRLIKANDGRLLIQELCLDRLFLRLGASAA
ncbi:chemotaxis protein CheW [Pseudoduganella namucuonensis]|uniref:Chemotaxis signal transduction protein n=1 Tax=Pseudoduganella namucuonensis TaxID=1035707 RepID=A0A1I7L2W7_9BURK|nr:chemotaxis protein CheW [Pseudoduganella namucuonensis]SFV03978.1 Chemotaxis signal transduction protein [Pseudoduganella namucuonensis]